MSLFGILAGLAAGYLVFRAVWWVGSIWIAGAEVLDEHSE